MLGISTTNLRVNGFRGGIDADAKIIYNRIIADSGVSNLSRLNYLVKGLKTIYGSLSNTPVCYDAHWIGYQPANGVGATSGQACAKLYSLTVAGDAVQATASAQPLLLAHNGAVTDNYWYGSGVSGNYVASNANTTFQFNSDFAIFISGVFKSGIILSKFLGSDYVELSQNSGTIRLTYYNGSTFALNIIFGAISTTAFTYLKLNRAGNVYTLTQSTDNITYTLVGTATNSTVIPTINSPLYISNGGAWGGNGNGNFYSVIFYNNGTFTSIVANFNPAQYNAATSQTQWTSSTSEVWTINQSIGQTLHGCLVDRTMTQGAGTTYSLAVASLAATQPYTEYVMANRIGTGNFISRVTGNVRGHDATNYSLNNGTLLTLANTSRNRQLLTYRSNGASSGIAVNNGTETTGNSGTNNGTNLTILEGAHIINTIIQTNIEDTTPQRLAMFNFIKTLNNL